MLRNAWDNNRNHYELLDHDPTREYQQQINHIFMEDANLNITDGEVKNTLITKHPRIVSFYTLPKMHKQNKAVRPVGSGIGTAT